MVNAREVIGFANIPDQFAKLGLWTFLGVCLVVQRGIALDIRIWAKKHVWTVRRFQPRPSPDRQLAEPPATSAAPTSTAAIADEDDFIVTTQRVYRSPERPSQIRVGPVEGSEIKMKTA